jgi:8-amino-7-oxononanoate synthase
MSKQSSSERWEWSGDILRDLERRHMLRAPEALSPVSGSATVMNTSGSIFVNFASNDYLGLAHHADVVHAAQDAALRYGTGAGSSRLISGNLTIHERLEVALAEFKRTEGALVFSSGYLASIGLIQALRTRPDGSSVPVFMDRLAHACIVDGALMGRQPWKRFAHNDPEALRKLLDREAKSGKRRGSGPFAIVVTEGVFSMDGDTAPVPHLLQACEDYDALLVLDDAHGTGTIGDDGRGTAAYFGAGNHPCLIQLGTLSKALGSQGGFVAGPRAVIELMWNRARTLIFDTALAPPCAAAALAALTVLQRENERIAALHAQARLLRQAVGGAGKRLLPGPGGLNLADSPVVPLLIGNAENVIALAQELRMHGFLTGAIRPPTVPQGTSRLRFAANALHTMDQVNRLGEIIKNLVK